MDKLIQRKKLIDLLPEFMKQFKEIQEIMKVEEKMLQGVEEQVEIILNNAFIERCDEENIKHYVFCGRYAGNSKSSSSFEME